jgi:hypothetical protein
MKMQLPDRAKPRPQRVPELHEVTALAERVANMVDKIHKQRNARALPYAEFRRIMTEMGSSLAKRMQELEDKKMIEPEVADAFIKSVREDWTSIKVKQSVK